jgi:exopolysaccharide production protein ExoQ
VSGLSTGGRALTPDYREPLRESVQIANLQTSARWRFGIRHLLFCASMVVLIFSNDKNYAEASQVIGVGLIILSGGAFFATTTGKPLSITYFDAIILFSIFLSYCATIISQEIFVLAYTTLFLIAYLSIMVIAQKATDDELKACIQVSIIVVLALVVVFFGNNLLATLTPGALRRWELREAPFGMHPNLAGFVYGGFIVMTANSQFSGSGRNKLIKPAIILLCLAVMVAASARGGLLAVVLTLAVYVFTEVVRGRNSRVYIVLIGFALIIFSFVFWDQILAYATEMFDLNSKQRGLESGGTGRLEIWQRGVEYITSRNWEIFIGSGLRSANLFPTESSYINLGIESGVFLMTAILFCFLSLLLYSYRRQKSERGFYRFAFYTLLFAMFQSVFNRYLIAIGNPFSLCILIIATKTSLRWRRKVLYSEISSSTQR